MGTWARAPHFLSQCAPHILWSRSYGSKKYFTYIQHSYTHYIVNVHTYLTAKAILLDVLSNLTTAK